ncbi:protein of unknown function [Xenorhabdus poinarii G6]|uniref:Uncharacterized protein n=1 Tax=Xenorhabdus poinarii G6 TaxID=1354304 RepID=A0A068QZL2_9GAMM|nr:protein of unknown function [Xenorhabdus poinarii G6]
MNISSISSHALEHIKNKDLKKTNEGIHNIQPNPNINILKPYHFILLHVLYNNIIPAYKHTPR